MSFTHYAVQDKDGVVTRHWHAVPEDCMLCEQGVPLDEQPENLDQAFRVKLWGDDGVSDA